MTGANPCNGFKTTHINMHPRFLNHGHKREVLTNFSKNIYNCVSVFINVIK